MSDKTLLAPIECSGVQQPVQPPNGLQEQLFALMKQPSTTHSDALSGKHPGAYTGAEINLTGADGTRLQAQFSVTSLNGNLQLTMITDLKTGQIDLLYPAAPDAAPWRLDLSAFKKDIDIYVAGQGQSRGERFYGHSDSAIKIGQGAQGRSSTSWIESRPNGQLDVHASFNEANGSVASEIGSVHDLNGSTPTAFAYTFNPDGNATSCAHNGTPDLNKPMVLDWSFKL